MGLLWSDQCLRSRWRCCGGYITGSHFRTMAAILDFLFWIFLWGGGGRGGRRPPDGPEGPPALRPEIKDKLIAKVDKTHKKPEPVPVPNNKAPGAGWRVEGGGWRVEGGRWKVEGGGPRPRLDLDFNLDLLLLLLPLDLDLFDSTIPDTFFGTRHLYLSNWTWYLYLCTCTCTCTCTPPHQHHHPTLSSSTHLDSGFFLAFYKWRRAGPPSFCYHKFEVVFRRRKKTFKVNPKI